MKIPGIFTKSPKYHKFEYKPRYYDPKKEEHEAREERARQELAREEGKELEQNGSTYDHRARMKGAFNAARKRSAPATKGEPNYALIRSGIVLILVLLLLGFLQWGPKVVYALFLVFPVWAYFRFFRKSSTDE